MSQLLPIFSLKSFKFAALAALAGTFLSPAYADDLSDALSQGTVTLQVRPRIETVDQTGKAGASAFTVRTMLGFSTAPLDGFGATVQMIDVAHAGDGYNSLVNGETKYATIPDPGGANVNQAYLSYSGMPKTIIKAGRQIIILDDARFVGNVDFRQTMQTFDAVTASTEILPHTKIDAAYVWNIKDILNQIVPTHNYLAQGAYAPIKQLKIEGFGYWYANDANKAILGAAGCVLKGIKICNSATYGFRASGTVALPAAFKFSYDGSYAEQRPYAGGSSLIDADYWHAGAKLAYQPVFIGLDDMMMGSNSNGTYGFQTPMATKHAFNGWAEIFLTTPAKGLDSKYATVGATIAKATLLARYYEFRSDYGNLAYGNEGDFSASYKITPQLTATAEYADYRTRGFGANTNAGWMYLTLNM